MTPRTIVLACAAATPGIRISEHLPRVARQIQPRVILTGEDQVPCSERMIMARR